MVFTPITCLLYHFLYICFFRVCFNKHIHVADYAVVAEKAFVFHDSKRRDRKEFCDGIGVVTTNVRTNDRHARFAVKDFAN